MAEVEESPIKIKGMDPLLASCKVCRHVFVIVWIPCDARMLERTKPKVCPACGANAANLFVADREFGDLDRYVAVCEVALEQARELARPPEKAIAKLPKKRGKRHE